MQTPHLGEPHKAVCACTPHTGVPVRADPVPCPLRVLSKGMAHGPPAAAALPRFMWEKSPAGQRAKIRGVSLCPWLLPVMSHLGKMMPRVKG